MPLDAVQALRLVLGAPGQAAKLVELILEANEPDAEKEPDAEASGQPERFHAELDRAREALADYYDHEPGLVHRVRGADARALTDEIHRAFTELARAVGHNPFRGNALVLAISALDRELVPHGELLHALADEQGALSERSQAVLDR